MSLHALGEGGLIRKIRERFKADVAVPIGDDAAVFDVGPENSLVFCSDLVAEKTHFLRDLHSPESIAYKAIAANVSDVGAMGGTPRYFLISFSAPSDLSVSWMDSFLDGVARACADYDVALLGGDSASSDSIFVDVSMVGVVPKGKAIGRFGAKRGDSVYVTGALGGSIMGLKHLKSGLRDEAVERHLFPKARHKVGASAREEAHAMIDISDGLSTDLSHILEESHISARIDKDRIPAWPGAEDREVLHGGEEYELIIVAPKLPDIIDEVPLTRIGEIVDSEGEDRILLIDRGQEQVLRPQGWQHF